jgi:hypothetical protein
MSKTTIVNQRDVTNLTGSNMMGELYGGKKITSSSSKVPKMPKFQANKNENPLDFIENFERLMKAHKISEERYNDLLALCLDRVDVMWLISL